MTGPLTEAMLGAAQPEVRSALEGRADLEALLEAVLACAREAWPSFELPAAGFIAHLAARIRDVASLDTPRGHVDLYLAFASLRGLGPAVAEVEGRARTQATRAARRLHLTADETEDLVQEMLVAVLVRDEGDASGDTKPPGIARYSGQGPLDAWLAAIAFRIALRRRDKSRRESPDGTVEEKANEWEQADPELRFVKERYRDHFDAAFRHALQGLSAREKNVLKLYLGGLNIERIGVCYGVHRATVARWIGDARERLLADTRTRLAGNLALEESEVDSLVGLLRSQVEVSLMKYLVTSKG